MDKRLKEINERLVDFSFGRFDRRISISDKKDLLDGISNAINMLGEELNEFVISKNYFNSIFNSVSDMVFILEKNHTITDLNTAALEKSGFSRQEILGKKISFILKDVPLTKRGNKSNDFSINSLFQSHPRIRIKNGKCIPVRITVSHFKDSSKKKLKVFTATDITSEILQENLSIRAIIDTQENERQRIAKDLHDTLVQQLTAIKFQIGSTLSSVRNKSIEADLQQSNQILSLVIKEVRNICFNLMPALLKEFGLIKAVREFSFLFNPHTTFQIIEDIKFPKLSQELNIDLYRILQELISNSIKHGKATFITIKFNKGKNSLKISHNDNGTGFDTLNFKRGMGLQNIQSRIKSHNGTFTIESSLRKGCTCLVVVPIFENL